ncbi:3-deoxy-D-manno-octulosonic acid transferase [Paracoccus spongiarum]|uniref:3-deoxy-D-manno-octulosonic acid transferase n=1 Tax=Paracoccus spongiarum TaxID=3064387 RepID=A0ABT9JCE4_9RHOB|nr:glycosyltransferase N-terminal domain-containing protein [Paracoccus sp. 2205BS29-5]MDP5307473.1 glycosyltransferase N-terminal domain-containing protein [Paracoccus sp. 2205BS29-5]
MAGGGLGRLGLWLHLRSRPDPASARIELPPGDGPLLLMHVSAAAETAAAQVLARLRRGMPKLRVLDTRGLPPLPLADNSGAAQTLLDEARPAALLLLGADLPPALIAAAAQRRLPVMLAEARLTAPETGWGLRAAMRRRLLQSAGAVLVTDPESHRIAIRMGADPARVVLTGPVAEIREPLRCTEAERSGFAQLLSGRHAWLAASVPESEEQAVLTAHRAAMRQSHRALLFLAPRDPARVDPLAAQLEAEGLLVARRSLDEEPTEEIHALITDGPTEMGLWYRLAPVTYMGGTLSGEVDEARHPFEPAALGSAIVHGPATGRHPTEWQQLDGAGAARMVGDAEALAATIAELTQPDLVAALASAAWAVSTGGADVAQRIAGPVLDALRGATR